MGGGTERLVERQLVHLDAVRRLRRGIERYPDARAGLERSASVHIERARRIAEALCCEPGAQGGTSALRAARAVVSSGAG